jgi:hypothetical protein
MPLQQLEFQPQTVKHVEAGAIQHTTRLKNSSSSLHAVFMFIEYTIIS